MTPPRAATNAQNEPNGGQGGGGGTTQPNNQPGGANSTEPQLIHIPQNQQEKRNEIFARSSLQE